RGRRRRRHDARRNPAARRQPHHLSPRLRRGNVLQGSRAPAGDRPAGVPARRAAVMAPSAWVARWAPLIAKGTVLDVACGEGRHAKLFLDRGLQVVAIDREPRNIPGARFIQADLEDGSPWPLAGEYSQRFEGIVVTNYLHRPLFPTLAA